MHRSWLKFAGLLLLISAVSGCKKDPELPPATEEKGCITLKFSHEIDGNPLVTDSLMYTNAAGNEYLVNEIQYFISEVVLHASDGTTVTLNSGSDIHYIDTDIPSTWEWVLPDSVKAGNYTSVSFIFGISEAKNISYMFPNPPERDMAWPEFLGGGYHYMKLNGKWKDTTDQVVPFDFHLGIGQIYAGGVVVVDSITGFVQNYFTVTLDNTSFAINKNARTSVEIRMNVESWFETPHVWDFNYWGSYIMQNQEAMQTAKENGYDVFTIGNITY